MLTGMDHERIEYRGYGGDYLQLMWGSKYVDKIVSPSSPLVQYLGKHKQGIVPTQQQFEDWSIELNGLYSWMSEFRPLNASLVIPEFGVSLVEETPMLIARQEIIKGESITSYMNSLSGTHGKAMNQRWVKFMGDFETAFELMHKPETLNELTDGQLFTLQAFDRPDIRVNGNVLVVDSEGDVEFKVIDI